MEDVDARSNIIRATALGRDRVANPTLGYLFPVKVLTIIL